MFRKCLYIVALTITFAGCKPVNSGSDLNTPSKTPSLIFSTEVAKSTDTPNPSTSVPATITATQIPEESNNSVLQECLNMNAGVFDIQQITRIGTVAGVENKPPSSPVILNLETEIRTAVPLQSKDSVATMHVSPNGNYIAYVEFVENDSGIIQKQVVWVVDGSGNVLASQSINPEVIFTEWRWLDDERIEFNFLSRTPKDGTVVIYYPFQDRWQYLSNSLPGFYKYFDLDQPWWLVDYSADLEWVIYLGEVNQFVIGPKLLDINSQEIVWQVADTSTRIKVPKWSPMSDKVAAMSGDSLYIIDRSGIVLVSPKLGDDFEIMSATWSPNGNYLVLLVRHNLPTPIGYVMLYDVQTNNIIDFCIKSDSLLGVRPPLWSVDSQLIFFQLITEYDDGPRVTPIIIDIMKDSLFQLSGDIEPLAWMNSLP